MASFAIFTLSLTSASLNIYHLRQCLLIFFNKPTTLHDKQSLYQLKTTSSREDLITSTFKPTELVNLIFLHIVQIIISTFVATTPSTYTSLSTFNQLVLQLLYCALTLFLFAIELRCYFPLFGSKNSSKIATFLLSYFSLLFGLLYALVLLYTFYLENPLLLYRLMVVDVGAKRVASSADVSTILCNRSFENRSIANDALTCYSPLLKPI